MLNVHPLRWAVAPVAFGILVLSGCGKQEEASAPAASTQPTPASSMSVKSPTPIASSSAGEMKAPAGEMKAPAAGMKAPSAGMKPQGTQCAGDEPVKGNVKGEKKIYHVPGSKGYEDTKPETCFKTAADAEKAGFHAPK